MKKFIETFIVEEVAQALKLHPYTICRLCCEDKIFAFSAHGESASGRKFGEQWRVDIKEIEEWKRKQGSTKSMKR